MAIIAFVSLVTAVSCIFMIRHKITNDIEDQMESIGVLEALGYRSREISGAYIYEYLLLGMIGVIIGGVLILSTDPLMTRLLQVFTGHNYVVSGKVYLLLVPAVLLIFLILITALFKARKIKKYPPVVAFRKGIRTHHFGRNVFPLDKTKSDINSRLGFKGLFANARQNVGLFICILAASLVVTFCVYLADIFRDRGAVFLNIAGVEKALMVGFDKGTDFDSVMQEISTREDVRKCVLLRANMGFTINGNDNDTFQSFAYEDYDELENLVKALSPSKRSATLKGRKLMDQDHAKVHLDMKGGRLEMALTIDLRENIDFIKNFNTICMEINKCLYYNSTTIQKQCRALASSSTK